MCHHYYYHHTFHISRKSALYLIINHHPKVILQLYFGGWFHHYNTDFLCHQIIKTNSRMANEITFDNLPQAVGYLTEQVERIHKIVAALQPQQAIDKHRIVEIDEACQITRKATDYLHARTQGADSSLQAWQETLFLRR